MPKIKYQPPKYCKIKIRKKQYAAVYLNGKTIYLGAYGSPESKTAYARFVAGLKVGTAPYLPENKGSVTVQALVLSFLDHVKGTITPQSYGHHRSAVQTLLKLYGDDTFVGSFTPRCLKLFRQELINSKRLCRNMVNDHTRRIVSMFTWGVEEELVQPHTEHKFGGGSVYGICNHPDAITTTFTNPWTTVGTRNPAWKPGVMQREIPALRHQLYDIDFRGVFLMPGTDYLCFNKKVEQIRKPIRVWCPMINCLSSSRRRTRYSWRLCVRYGKGEECYENCD